MGSRRPGAALLGLAAFGLLLNLRRGEDSNAFAASGRTERTADEGAGLSSRRETLLAAGVGLGAAPALAESSVPVGGEVVKLNNGLTFPKVSFGLQVYDDSTAQRLTELAISVGYRNFFASVLAGNQRGFAAGFKASGIPREEVFICGTVLSNNAVGYRAAYELTKKGWETNMRDLGTGGITYVDMIMLDYPGRDCASITGQWEAFELMLSQGLTKSLAVSNFSPEQLDCILKNKTKVVPTVNQLPYSVGGFDGSAVEENRKRGVVVQAWSPLSSGMLGRRASNTCEEIGKKYGKSGAQVALRWILQTGATFSTQSKVKEHFVEDLNIFDFELTPEEMERLSNLGRR